jgi:hypothetical protein
MRHLSYSKSLYFHALQHSGSENVMDRAISIVNLDGAVEMFFYALVEHVGVGISENAKFFNIVDVVKQKIIELNGNPSILQETSIKNMHRE